MRPSRSILTAAAIAAASAATVVGVLGSSSTVAAAPAARVSAPVAIAPDVVAHAVVAPKKAVAAAKASPKATHRATTTAHRTVTRTVAAKAPETAAPKPTATKAATKPATTTTTTTAAKTGNDYPYASATTNTADKWGFTQRQCVSFAAWRLARAGHAINNSSGWGSAYHWDETARALGVRVSSTPHVGAIAQWNVGEGGSVWMNGGKGHFSAGEYGHVGYVAAVYSDGSALIEQYNVMGDRNYSVLRMTAPRYLF